MGRWFIGSPAYQSGPGKGDFRIDVSMASQSSSSESLLAASRSRNKLLCSSSTSSEKRFRKRWLRCHRNVDLETILPRTGLIRGTPKKPSVYLYTYCIYIYRSDCEPGIWWTFVNNVSISLQKAMSLRMSPTVRDETFGSWTHSL